MDLVVLPCGFQPKLMRNRISVFVYALACFASVDAAKRPNVVLIMADDFGLPISVATGRKSKHPISTHWQRRDCGFRNTAKCHSPRVLRRRLVLGAAGNSDLDRINRYQHALAQGVTSPGMFVVSFRDSP